MDQELAASFGWELPRNEENPRRASSRRWPYVAAIVVLVVALATVGAGFYFTYVSAQEWSATATQRAADLASTTRQRDALSAQLTAAQSDLASTKSALADTTTKFNDASARIRSLADEKAQVGDRAALLAESVALSHQVSTELDSCVNNLQQLEGYLVNFQNYDLPSLINLSGQINAGCRQARSDNAALAQKLGAG